MNKYLDSGNLLLLGITGFALYQIFKLERELGRIEASKLDDEVVEYLG